MQSFERLQHRGSAAPAGTTPLPDDLTRGGGPVITATAITLARTQARNSLLLLLSRTAFLIRMVVMVFFKKRTLGVWCLLRHEFLVPQAFSLGCRQRYHAN